MEQFIPSEQEDLIFSSFECHTNTTERPGFPGNTHWHYFGEIIRVRSGCLNVRRRDKVWRLSAGDAILINPLTPHSLDYGTPGVPAEYEVFRMDANLLADLPSYTPDLRAMMLEAERSGISMVLTAEELNERNLKLTLDACMWEFAGRDYGYDLRIRSLMYLFFTEVIRRWIAAGFSPQNYASSIDPIYTLPNYIAHHIREPLKVEELARYCGLSYPWFARKFHEIYGISCKEYIEMVRIRRVEHYLQFTDCDLNYISQHTGYADCSHLVRDFRKLRNTTPGQFRQAIRQKAQGSGQFPQNY